MKPTLHAFTGAQRAAITNALNYLANSVKGIDVADILALLRQPLTFGEAINQIGDDATNAFVAAAHEHDLLSEGTLEVDGKTIVSQSDDGAYVMVWLWIDNEDAGVEREPTGMEEG